MLILQLSLQAQIIIWHYFTKPKMLFWKKQLLYAQIPNANLALILQGTNTILALLHKTQMLFWHILTKLKY